ncbi:MAG: hypothetical protein QOI25_1010 [Mycobacterium sp.]|nr:hypothetical protein [Mycobacterium sp.]
MMRTRSLGMPKAFEYASSAHVIPWTLSQTVSWSPSQRATVAGSSMGLWLLRAIEYCKSVVTAALRSAASASPRA